MESIPKQPEENSLVEKMNHCENYRFYGFDNSIDETSNYSCNTTKNSGNVKSMFDSQMSALKNTAIKAKADTDPKLEANLKTL